MASVYSELGESGLLGNSHEAQNEVPVKRPKEKVIKFFQQRSEPDEEMPS
jgi:hypothetical protein